MECSSIQNLGAAHCLPSVKAASHLITIVASTFADTNKPVSGLKVAVPQERASVRIEEISV
jgi:hypothetical protein